MALKWLEGFEAYGVTNGNSTVDFIGKYSSVGVASAYQIKAGRIGGKCMWVNTVSSAFETPQFSNQATWTVGFGYKQDGMGGMGDACQIRDASASQIQIDVVVGTAGEIWVFRGASQVNLIGVTRGANLRPGVWAYIEIQTTINNTTGTVIIRVNGNTVLNLTGQNTRGNSNNFASSVRFTGNATGGSNSYFDDIYICDGSGSNNTTFLGPQKVVAILPSADNGSQQWSTSSGSTHFSLVNENPPDDSTTYVQDTVSGHVDLWDYANTPSTIANIKGVQVNTVFEDTDATAFSLVERCVSGATTSDASSVAGTNGTFKVAAFVLETDPNTSALWTQSNLDAAQFGVKVA